MKKPYQKPNLYVEKFVLAEHIAATCGYSIRHEINYFDFRECEWNLDGATVFTTGNTSCFIKVDGSDSVEFKCYDLGVTPTEDEPFSTIYS